MTARVRLPLRLFQLFVVLLLVVVCSPYSARDYQLGWKGILPLHSTRMDVENRLGTATAECHCAYSTANEAIAIDYATGRCQGPPYGWNVPAGTVLRITVSPKQRTTVSESDLLANGYVKNRQVEDPLIYYTNLTRGIKYAIDNGVVNSISYIPSSNDITIRCAGFPPYDGGLYEYHPYASFSSKAKFINERLDQFGAQLTHDEGLKGYIITYAGPRSKHGEAKQMADSAKRHLIQEQHVSADRIFVIDGGVRATSDYELFLIPADMPPPTPTPTLASNKVRSKAKLSSKGKQRIRRTGQCRSILKA